VALPRLVWDGERLDVEETFLWEAGT